MNIFIIDNYDSFTYNLYQYIGEILSAAKHHGRLNDFAITVKRNDEVTLDEIANQNPDRIIISPGPGSPEDEDYFGICSDVIRELGKSTPLLGVCLGMQGIVHTFGGRITHAPLPMHGKVSAVTHNGCGVFSGIPGELEVMRYHSLMAEHQSFPDCLELTAFVGDFPANAMGDNQQIQAGGNYEIMAVRHREFPIQGIQFHPESFATEAGRELIENFLYQNH